MNGSVASNDLARLLKKEWKLAKISEAARKMAGELARDKTDIKDVHDAITGAAFASVAAPQQP